MSFGAFAAENIQLDLLKSGDVILLQQHWGVSHETQQEPPAQSWLSRENLAVWWLRIRLQLLNVFYLCMIS